ncbi:MAG TPA: chromosomal replication initiator protein DnaA [Candidatus Paceibacterota bacterium]
MQTLNNEELWVGALAEIELEVSKANFLTWFKNTAVAKFDREIVYISVPNAFVRDWLYNKYHKSILRALRKNLESIRNIEYVITRDGPRTEKRDRPQIQMAHSQLEIQEIYINKEDNLNPRYTFDSFIVGSFNELAHAAAQAVIKNPGISYNPLFIYGGTGLGKTHLIQAIGNYFKRLDANKKVHYLSSEKFTIECVDSIRNNKVGLFKEKYRKYDILIMDDVQFLSGKDRTQEELFYLFNTLYENNKQIVFSSDKAPKHIPGIEERLKSRFEGGMMADISVPEYEARLSILSEKMKVNDILLPEEVIEYIASVVQNNIRELEGVFNSVVCQTQLKKRNLSLPEVKILIKNSIKPPKSITINDVIKTIANFYNIEETELYEKTRKKEVVKPRQVVMYILREDFNTSYPYIGQKLGGRDHTTVIHAYEKIKRDLAVDSVLAQELEQIKILLYGE